MARKVDVPGAGRTKIINPWVAFISWLSSLLPFEIPYGQHHLNRLWEHVATEREKASLGLRGPVGAYVAVEPSRAGRAQEVR